MHQLPTHTRISILRQLVEGASVRSTARLVGVDPHTVLKLLRESGSACEEFHHTTVRGLCPRRVECDEIWSFVQAKQKNAPRVIGNHEWVGTVWTWTSLDPDSKLLVSWLLGNRTEDTAREFMADLRRRLEGRVQITTDGLTHYRTAVEESFGGDADFAQLVKVVSWDNEESVTKSVEIVSGNPDERFISTSLVERMNRSMRMGMRRYTRKTDAFSKTLQNHRNMLALYFGYYNFIRVHSSIGTTPAVAAGLDTEPRSMEWILEMVENRRTRAKWGSRGDKGILANG